MNEREQLERAIAALEGQRGVLGEAVVQAAVGPLRDRLQTLQAAGVAVQQRKLATVLFADIAGFTPLSEMMDAEDVAELLNALWKRMDAAITHYGGHIDKHIGDAVMAIWGVEAAREDDPELAIRAALSMQTELAKFNLGTNDYAHPALSMRIGINTGPVLLGEVGTMHEFTAMGDTVNLASRLQSACPTGRVLIAHNTYRHVRGVFDIEIQDPLQVKGKHEPVQVYLVRRAKLARLPHVDRRRGRD
jgi:class 3 adenylate cyclase